SDARDFMKKLRTENPELAIIMISSLGDLPTIETLFKQGADGYLLKSDPKTEIVRAIKIATSRSEKLYQKGLKQDILLIVSSRATGQRTLPRASERYSPSY